MTLFDASQIENGGVIQSQVCIIGAGAAGLALAQRLLASNLDVVLLESGGDRRDLAAERECFAIDEIGEPMRNPEASRGRGYGGSLGLWYGRLALLDSIDFEHRPWVSSSGWPISGRELDPWLRQSAELFGMPRFDLFELDAWPSSTTTDAFPAGGDLELRVFRWAKTITHLADVVRPTLEAAKNLRLILDATAIELVSQNDAEQVDTVLVSGRDGKRFSVRAHVFVLASGGIENPRLLLASTGTHPTGLGNNNDLVGRYYMDHPRGEGLATAKFTHPSHAAALRMLGQGVSSDFGDVQYRFTFTKAVQREHGLLNHAAHLHIVNDVQTKEGFSAAKRLLQRIRGRASAEMGKASTDVLALIRDSPALAWYLSDRIMGRQRATGAVFIDQMEQEPDFHSRLTVDSSRRDMNGLPRVVRDWRIGESTRRSQHFMHATLRRVLASIGINEFKSALLEEPTHQPGLWDMKHPSGTTRMSQSPSTGVVNPDLRLHDARNVYVVGTSVFPTVGHANPTLTIVALAARLADHIAREWS